MFEHEALVKMLSYNTAISQNLLLLVVGLYALKFGEWVIKIVFCLGKRFKR
jgi:hypothetical protein